MDELKSSGCACCDMPVHWMGSECTRVDPNFPKNDIMAHHYYIADKYNEIPVGYISDNLTGMDVNKLIETESKDYPTKASENKSKWIPLDTKNELNYDIKLSKGIKNNQPYDKVIQILPKYSGGYITMKHKGLLTLIEALILNDIKDINMDGGRDEFSKNVAQIEMLLRRLKLWRKAYIAKLRKKYMIDKSKRDDGNA